MIGMDLPSGNLTYGKSPFNDGYTLHLPSGKHTKNHGKSPYKKPWKITIFFMGKSTLNYHVFHSFVELPEGNMTGMDSVDGK